MIYYQVRLHLKLNPVLTPVSLIIMDQEVMVDIIIIIAQLVKVYILIVACRLPTIMATIKEVIVIGIGMTGATDTILTGHLEIICWDGQNVGPMAIIKI